MMNSIEQPSIVARKYADDFSLPVEIAQIVARRHPEYDQAAAFLRGGMELLHDPDTIPDIHAAAGRLIEAVRQGRKVLIYCHDDPDGFTSAVVAYETLLDISRERERQIFVYPIVRDVDGYILNPKILRDYKARGVDLLLTVDFGISNRKNFEIARTEGMELIVCDHHESGISDFPVLAVDPKRVGSGYPYRELAGVGVATKLSQVIYREAFHVTAGEFYGLKKEFIVLTMVGTIADRVNMTGENRVYARRGIQIINHVGRPWLEALRKGGEIGIAFIYTDIIPLLVSAAHGDSRLGIRLLTTPDANEAQGIIQQLRDITDTRRRDIDRLFKESVDAAKVYPNLVISTLPSTKIHYLGALSSRLKDYYRKNVVIIETRENQCRGELRSAGLDLYHMLSDLKDLFIDYGGHKMAAGFSMDLNKYDEFVERASRYAGKAETGGTPDNLAPEAVLDKSQIHLLTPLMPFGEGNPAPILTDRTDLYTIDNKFNIIDKGIWQT
jgi:single-stranded-DNA-specific exonuclease